MFGQNVIENREKDHKGESPLKLIRFPSLKYVNPFYK